VRKSLFQGESIVLTIDLSAGQSVTLRVAANERSRRVVPQEGQRVRLGLHPLDTILLQH